MSAKKAAKKIKPEPSCNGGSLAARKDGQFEELQTMKDKTTDKPARGALHYRRTRWFKDYRGVSKHTLRLLARRNVVREIRDGEAQLSPLAWCVEDYDRYVAAENRLKGGAR